MTIDNIRRDMQTPLPGVSRTGVHLPWKAVWAIALMAAGGVTTYVFATKNELRDHATTEERERSDKVGKLTESVIVVQETEKRHDTAITELKSDVKELKAKMDAVEPNIRTMLIEVGVPASRIAKPKAQP